MGMTNAARNEIAAALINDSPTLFNNANAHIGVGNGTTAFAASQTDLQGASKLRKAMNGGYPSRVDNVLTFQATFGTAEANFAWEEWAVFNDASAGTMLQRLVENNGTKTSSDTWQLEVDITVEVGT